MIKSVIACVVLLIGALVIAPFSDGACPAPAVYPTATFVHAAPNGASPVAKRADVAADRLETLATAAAPIRFAAIDIIIDTNDQPLAVYQLEFAPADAADVSGVTIVGIEGGEHAAFRAAPYYDPTAIQQERVIIGAFNTAEGDKLPRGKVKVATIHVQITGAAGEDEKAPPPLPKFNVKLTVAATVDGKPIDATATTQVKGTQL